MGYTNYWKFKKSATEENYQEAKELIKKLVKFTMNKKGYEKILANGIGEKGTAPSLNDFISFNGVGDDSHETFYLHSTLKEMWEDGYDGFNFTKTARKPYDTVVVACQCALKYYMVDGVKISSDGIGYYQSKLEIDDEILYGIKLFIEFMIFNNFLFESDTYKNTIQCIRRFIEQEIGYITDDMIQIEIDNYNFK